jgi:hypothetical protein
MKKSLLTALALSLGMSTLALAQAPPPPVPVDADSDGLIDINSIEDLNEMRNDLAGTSLRGSTVGCPGTCRGYELTRNLDFDTNGDGIADWNQGRAWVPVGTTAAPFIAEFNGNGHAIRNIYIGQIDGVTSYGLFGVTDGASFITVRLEDPSVTVTPTNRNVSVGTLAGNLSNGYSRFVYVTNAEILTNTLTHAGGIFGRADRSTILEAEFSGEVFVGTQQNDMGNTASSAGIVGRATWSLLQTVSARGEIRGPRAAGLVETATNVGISRSFANVVIVGRESAGGLVGTAVYDKSDATLATNQGYYSINTSYAMGSIQVDTNFGGGLVRYAVRSDGATGRIINSFARMTIRGQQSNTTWSNVLQTANAGVVTINSSYWVTNPEGTVLTQRHGNVNATGYSLQDMQCAASPAVAGCANPNIFSAWTGWDFGTTSEMPALKLNPVYPWLSTDRPNANGDYETIGRLVERYPTQSCTNPWYLTAKVKNSPYLFTSTSVLSSYEKLAKFSPKEGLSCKNADQVDGACYDYQVSYLCDATPAYGGVYWTAYTDVDNPTSGTGDDEPLPAGQICPAGGPIGINTFVSGVVGRQGPPQKLATFSATEGLRCLNADNSCKDYEVQMQCGDVMSDR